MKKMFLVALLMAGGLAFVVHATLASACPQDLTCQNFTYDKKGDCEYLFDRLSQEEFNQTVCILWDQSYEFDSWQSHSSSRRDVTLDLESPEIDWSRIILASKIFLLGIFNYLVFSLGKSSYFAKWIAD